jgi:hypothetical protein
VCRGPSGSFEGTVPPSPQAHNALSGEREAKYQRSGAAACTCFSIIFNSVAVAARAYIKESAANN